MQRTIIHPFKKKMVADEEAEDEGGGRVIVGKDLSVMLAHIVVTTQEHIQRRD